MERTMTETIKDLAHRMETVKEAQASNPEYSIVSLMQANKVLFTWLESTGLIWHVESLEDMAQLKPFWVQLAKLGYEFSEDEKRELLQDRIGDN